MKNQRGQTIIEVVIAFGTASAILAAVAIVVLSALNNAQFSRNQKIATNYATEGIEIVRQIRDSDYPEFDVLGGGTSIITSGANRGGGIWGYCLDKNMRSLTTPAINGCGQNIDNLYVRQVNLEKNTTDCKGVGVITGVTEVTVYVAWNSPKCGGGSGSWAEDGEAGNNLFCHVTKLTSCLSNYGILPTPTP